MPPAPAPALRRFQRDPRRFLRSCLRRSRLPASSLRRRPHAHICFVGLRAPLLGVRASNDRRRNDKNCAQGAHPIHPSKTSAVRSAPHLIASSSSTLPAFFSDLPCTWMSFGIGLFVRPGTWPGCRLYSEGRHAERSTKHACEILGELKTVQLRPRVMVRAVLVRRCRVCSMRTEERLPSNVVPRRS